MRRQQHIAGLLVCLIASLAALHTARAQSTFGAILGRVTDPSGSPVPQAQVRVTNLATNVTATRATNENGNYEAPYLTPGTYRVSVEHPGFKSFIQPEVQVRVSARVAVDMRLEVGDVKELVNVSAAPPLVEIGRAHV